MTPWRGRTGHDASLGEGQGWLSETHEALRAANTMGVFS